MAKMKKIEPKECFTEFCRCEAFYTGGKIQFSNDGQYILTLCYEKLKKFHIANGKAEDAIDNTDELSSFLLADDNETLITASKSRVMRHWDFSTKTLQKTWKSLHIGPVSCMAFDSSVTLLATSGSDSTIKVWDIVRKYYTHNLKGGKGVFSKICFHKLGSELYIFATSDDYKIHVWNLHSSEHVASLEGHYSTITGLVFQNENTLFSSSRDKVVLIWELSDFSLKKTIPIYESIEACILAPQQLCIADVNLNSNETYFITAGDKGVLKVWSANSGKCVCTQVDSPVVLPEESSFEGSLITQGYYVPALNAIGITTFEHNILLYDLEKFSLKKQFVGYNDDILSMKFMGKSDEYLIVATNSSQIKVFQFPNFNCQLLKDHLDNVLDIDVFPKKRNIFISGSKDNCIKVWSMDKGSSEIKCLYTGFGHTDSVSAVACCRGKSLIFASGSRDTTLKLWKIPEDRPLIALKLLLSPYCTAKAHDKLINSIDIAENDKLVATGSQDHTAKIWDTNDLSLLGTLRGHKKGVWCVKFSPVDLVIATSSSDETIRIWSLVDFSCLKVFEGHEATVLQVHFLTRGTQLISSASDGNIKLWDIKHNICIKTMEGHTGRVWALTPSTSEHYVVSGGADSNIIVWEDTTLPEKEIKLAEQETFIKQEQKLSNLVHEKKWSKALGLAVTLDKPFMAYTIIEEILLQDNGEKIFQGVFTNMRQDQQEESAIELEINNESRENRLKSLIANFVKPDVLLKILTVCNFPQLYFKIEALLKFSAEWVTNTKTYSAAVSVISLFHSLYDFQELLKIPSMPSSIRDFLPYLDRHHKRLNRRCQDMQILNFLCQQFKLTGISGLKETDVNEIHETESEESILSNSSTHFKKKGTDMCHDSKKLRLDTVD